MATVVLVIHLMIAAALVAIVLLQRSEGGALGIGGGGGGGFMSGRGTANLLTRMTAALAAAFFVTSIVLTLLANRSVQAPSILDRATQPAGTAAPKEAGKSTAGGEQPAAGGGVLDKLKSGQSRERLPSVPTSQ